MASLTLWEHQSPKRVLCPEVACFSSSRSSRSPHPGPFSVTCKCNEHWWPSVLSLPYEQGFTPRLHVMYCIPSLPISSYFGFVVSGIFSIFLLWGLDIYSPLLAEKNTTNSHLPLEVVPLGQRSVAGIFQWACTLSLKFREQRWVLPHAFHLCLVAILEESWAWSSDSAILRYPSASEVCC